MKLFGQLFLLFSLASAAAEKIEFQISKVSYFFIEENGIFLSQECGRPKNSCEARKKIESVVLNLEEFAQGGGRNPGSKACDVAGGTLLLGVRPEDHSESTFCKFKDKSLVSSSALLKH